MIGDVGPGGAGRKSGERGKERTVTRRCATPGCCPNAPPFARNARCSGKLKTCLAVYYVYTFRLHKCFLIRTHVANGCWIAGEAGARSKVHCTPLYFRKSQDILQCFPRVVIEEQSAYRPRWFLRNPHFPMVRFVARTGGFAIPAWLCPSEGASRAFVDVISSWKIGEMPLQGGPRQNGGWFSRRLIIPERNDCAACPRKLTLPRSLPSLFAAERSSAELYYKTNIFQVLWGITIVFWKGLPARAARRNGSRGETSIFGDHNDTDWYIISYNFYSGFCLLRDRKKGGREGGSARAERSRHRGGKKKENGNLIKNSIRS